MTQESVEKTKRLVLVLSELEDLLDYFDEKGLHFYLKPVTEKWLCRHYSLELEYRKK